jgi:hypothetical protein
MKRKIRKKSLKKPKILILQKKIKKSDGSLDFNLSIPQRYKSCYVPKSFI